MFREKKIYKNIESYRIEAYCLPILTYCTTAINLSQNTLNSFNVCWNMMFRRVFHFNRWESVSMFIAGLGRLNFTHLLQFKMLKKFLCNSTNTVKHLIGYNLLNENLLEACWKFDICLSMSFGAIKSAVCEHFWSNVRLFE